MRKQLSLLSFFACITASTLSNAQNIEHGLWLDLSVAEIEETNDDPGAFTAELNDSSSGHLALSYELRFNRVFALGIGYLSGDSDEVEFIFDWFTDTEVEYSSFFAAAKISLPLSERNSLFVDINHHEYEFEVLDDLEVIEEQEGSDIGYVFGWRIDFNDTLGMEVGREYMPLGPDLTIKGARVGLKYQF